MSHSHQKPSQRKIQLSRQFKFEKKKTAAARDAQKFLQAFAAFGSGVLDCSSTKGKILMGMLLLHSFHSVMAENSATHSKDRSALPTPSNASTSSLSVTQVAANITTTNTVPTAAVLNITPVTPQNVSMSINFHSSTPISANEAHTTHRSNVNRSVEVLHQDSNAVQQQAENYTQASSSGVQGSLQELQNKPQGYAFLVGLGAAPLYYDQLNRQFTNILIQAMSNTKNFLDSAQQEIERTIMGLWLIGERNLFAVATAMELFLQAAVDKPIAPEILIQVRGMLYELLSDYFLNKSGEVANVIARLELIRYVRLGSLLRTKLSTKAETRGILGLLKEGSRYSGIPMPFPAEWSRELLLPLPLLATKKLREKQLAVIPWGRTPGQTTTYELSKSALANLPQTPQLLAYYPHLDEVIELSKNIQNEEYITYDLAKKLEPYHHKNVWELNFIIEASIFNQVHFLNYLATNKLQNDPLLLKIADYARPLFIVDPHLNYVCRLYLANADSDYQHEFITTFMKAWVDNSSEGLLAKAKEAENIGLFDAAEVLHEAASLMRLQEQLANLRPQTVEEQAAKPGFFNGSNVAFWLVALVVGAVVTGVFAKINGFARDVIRSAWDKATKTYNYYFPKTIPTIANEQQILAKLQELLQPVCHLEWVGITGADPKLRITMTAAYQHYVTELRQLKQILQKASPKKDPGAILFKQDQLIIDHKVAMVAYIKLVVEGRLTQLLTKWVAAVVDKKAHDEIAEYKTTTNSEAAASSSNTSSTSSCSQGEERVKSATVQAKTLLEWRKFRSQFPESAWCKVTLDKEKELVTLTIAQSADVDQKEAVRNLVKVFELLEQNIFTATNKSEIKFNRNSKTITISVPYEFSASVKESLRKIFSFSCAPEAVPAVTPESTTPTKEGAKLPAKNTPTEEAKESKEMKETESATADQVQSGAPKETHSAIVEIEWKRPQTATAFSASSVSSASSQTTSVMLQQLGSLQSHSEITPFAIGHLKQLVMHHSILVNLQYIDTKLDASSLGAELADAMLYYAQAYQVLCVLVIFNRYCGRQDEDISISRNAMRHLPWLLSSHAISDLARAIAEHNFITLNYIYPKDKPKPTGLDLQAISGEISKDAVLKKALQTTGLKLADFKNNSVTLGKLNTKAAPIFLETLDAINQAMTADPKLAIKECLKNLYLWLQHILKIGEALFSSDKLQFYNDVVTSSSCKTCHAIFPLHIYAILCLSWWCSESLDYVKAALAPKMASKERGEFLGKLHELHINIGNKLAHDIPAFRDNEDVQNAYRAWCLAKELLPQLENTCFPKDAPHVVLLATAPSSSSSISSSSSSTLSSTTEFDKSVVG